MAKHAADIGKDARDLINNDFPVDGTLKFTTQSKTANDITAKASVTRTVKKDKGVPKEIILATFEPKAEWKSHKLEFNAKVSTSNDLTGTLLLKDLLAKGSKVELTGTQNRDSPTGQLVISFLNTSIAAKGGVTVASPFPQHSKRPWKGNLELTGFFQKFFYAGFALTATGDNLVAPKVEGLGSYTNGPIEIYGSVSHDIKEEVTNTQLSFFYKSSPDRKLAADFNVDVTAAKSSANVSGEYKLDDSTTLKGKLVVKPTTFSQQPEFRMVGSVKQKLTPSLTSLIGVDLNINNFFGESTGETHSFGLDVKFQ